MRLQTQERNVQVIGSVMDKRAAQIELNPIIFEILSGKIYSDKILAVVRELSCNAVDAHKAVNNLSPFDVQLPTAIEPAFRIRDYGTGLSHEDVFNLYMTFGASSKRNSDSFIGGFGIGSKAPLAYTNTFTVNSFFNGEQRSYSVFIDDDGKPATMHVHTQKTDEPNGLEISVPVKASDTESFANTCATFYTYFNTVKPRFLGKQIEITQVNYINPETVLTNKFGWKQGNSINLRIPNTQAIVGNVAYPVDSRLVYNHMRSTSSSDAHRLMRDSFNVDFFFDVGEVDIAASREGLSYTPKTLNTITKRLEAIYNTELDYIQKRINKCKNIWEASIQYKKEEMSIGYWFSGQKDFFFKNKKLSTSIRLQEITGLNDKILSFYVYILDKNDFSTQRKRIHVTFEGHYYEISPYKTEQIVIVDTKVQTRARYRTLWDNFVKNKNNAHVVLIKGLDKNKTPQEHKIFLDAIKQQLNGCPEPLYLSSIEPDVKYVKQKVNTLPRKSVYLQVYDLSTGVKSEQPNFDLSTLTSEHVIIRTLEGFPVIELNGVTKQFDIDYIGVLLQQTGYKENKFFLCPTSRYSVKKIKECKNIITFNDFIGGEKTIEKLKDKLSLLNVAKNLENHNSLPFYLEFKNLKETEALSLCTEFKDFKQEDITEFLSFTDKIKNLFPVSKHNQYKAISSFLYKVFNYNQMILDKHKNLDYKTFGINLDATFGERFFDKYPLLQYIKLPSYGKVSTELKENVKKYVELVDKGSEPVLNTVSNNKTKEEN